MSKYTTNVNLQEFQNPQVPRGIARFKLEVPEEPVQVLRMLLRDTWTQRMAIPQDLAWVRPLVKTCTSSHVRNDLPRHPFCYLTIRNGVCKHGSDMTWHVDGFSMRVPHLPEINYLWSDVFGFDYTPVVAEFPKDFDPLVHNVNTFLERRIGFGNIGSVDPNTIYQTDPYLLHRRSPRTLGQRRCFVRLTFSPIEIDDVNNTQNPARIREYTKDGVAFRNTLKDYDAA